MAKWNIENEWADAFKGPNLVHDYHGFLVIFFN